MTRMPRCSDSATFSAACRQTLHVRKRLSPSFHSLVVLSMTRGVDATRKVATGWPDAVNRSSGSGTRLPTTVIGVSPAAIVALQVDSRTNGGLSAVLGPQNLGPQHALVEVELAVELLDGVRLGVQVDDGVDAFRLLVDRGGEATLPPDVELADLAPGIGNDLEEPLERRLIRALLEVGVEDDHDLVVTHARPTSSGLTRSRSFRDRRLRATELSPCPQPLTVPRGCDRPGPIGKPAALLAVQPGAHLGTTPVKIQTMESPWRQPWLALSEPTGRAAPRASSSPTADHTPCSTSPAPAPSSSAWRPSPSAWSCATSPAPTASRSRPAPPA